MRTLLPAVAVLLLAAGCGSDDPVAVDPGADDTIAATAADPPATPVEVRTRDIATVMDAGTGVAELCLGPVAESWPPQCSGPTLAGWDWSDHRGTFERSGPVRWGTYAVQGTWDGTTFTYGSAVPAAIYDPAPSPSPTMATPAEPRTAEELEDIAAEVTQDLPGVLGSWVVDASVVLDVVHDDGSLQRQVDRTYGAGTVIVRSALLPVGT